ncbi:DUF4190 domain-containing protein [Promicromonospora sukumoe]|uniref:DUF4190 domain-containing protein n=1 Tax=Promicromonospora sukumoe TaxID=88382 RepID=UPI000378E0F0|nr:DUF4190 domain-containing protein [Promicromonospora sukumoe]
MGERESERTQDLRFTVSEPATSETLPLPPPSSAAPGPTPPSVVPSPYGPAGVPAAQVNPHATTSLVLGITSLFLSLLFVPSILGIILGFVGLARSRRTDPPTGRGAAIAGIVLSVVGVVLGVFVAMAASTFVSDAAKAIVDRSTAAPEGETTPAPPADFVEVDAAQWKSVVEHPGKAEGQAVVVFAEVARFDSTTGTDRFLGGLGVDQPGTERELEDPAVVIGPEVMLDGVETGDLLRIHAVVTGSFELRTDLGGTVTVPALTISKFEDVGFADLGEDLAVGSAETKQPGWITVPVTVTNSGTQVFTYSATLVAESKDGKKSYDRGPVFVEKLGPGKEEKVAVDFFEDVPADAVYRVESVERFVE